MAFDPYKIVRDTKQVIVIRKDLKMRRGKEIAQGAHASMGALLSICDKVPTIESIYGIVGCFSNLHPVYHWLKGSFTKITVTVNSEDELVSIQARAKQYNIPHCLITDNGKTEFNGVPTITCLAIGPWWSDEIDTITKDLPLY